MRNQILGVIRSEVLGQVSSGINSSVLRKESHLGLVQSNLLWGLNSHVGRSVFGRVDGRIS